MRRIAVYSAPRELTSPRWAEAFIRGCGVETELRCETIESDGPLALFGSPQYAAMLELARQHSFEFYYGDHGFFGRGKYYRCARNTTMVTGQNGDDDPARFMSFRIAVKPWRKQGRHVLLCPNSPAFLHRTGAAAWVSETLEALKQHTDRPIRVRWKKDRKRLAADLAGAWAVVTFASNAAVEAILAGVPAFCASPCAALTMGSDDLSMIETPRMPDGREQWAARLANSQWTLQEMADGMLWRAIGC